MSLNTRLSLGIATAFALVVGVLLVVNATKSPSTPSSGGTVESRSGETVDPRLVRPDSHRLDTAPDGKVTFVEFLDFECEACAAAFPAIEKLREQYDGKVTFVVRYFPIESHFNAERAARAVEAASKQGKFEAMYQKMYQSQGEWGEQQVPADAKFRSFAKDLGLDLTAFDKAYADPATLARVKKDAEDGIAVGVRGTPSFFLNGKQIQPQSLDELTAAIDAELNR
ncbi:DsbA family protein [Kribbella deserti]|uniref:DsbA family protein n=1 Tax=Kribbella deserti TaxID=1926257 RepID=A0ABV6QH75_9ACTN